MTAKSRKYEVAKGEKCKFVIRDGDCSKCPHKVEASAKHDAYIPICYKEPEDETL